MERERIVDQLRKLEQRFLRIDRSDDRQGQRETMAAMAAGGQILVKASELEMLPFRVPRPETQNSVSEDASLDFTTRWDAAMLALSYLLPDEFPCNPASIRWKTSKSEDCEKLRVGTGSKADWRIRAENYAHACGVLVDLLSTPVDGPVDVFRWRHKGEVVEEKMAPGAWRLANHLFHAENQTASYEELAPVVADDHAETLLDRETCRGHQSKANKFFKEHGIRLSISLRGQPTLEDI